jgi:uncharacterized protein with ParB-like and HNH nuclease domain
VINNANKYTISDIFSIDSAIKYKIPRFQREYTWNRENWEQLLNDIDESEGSHFIGSIICINQGTDSLSPVLELIDGQQRLTTLSLLFCAVYKLLSTKKDDVSLDLGLEVGNLKYRLVQKLVRADSKIELSKQNNNFGDYRSVLGEIGVLNAVDDPKNKGNRRVWKCYRYFLNTLETLPTEKLVAFLAKVNNTMLVKIEVSSHADAFLLFESLNNRGVPLSAIDLIKNKVLAVMEQRNILTVDEAFDRWNKIIDYLDDYPVQERFLRQLYNAFKYDEKIKVEGATKATKSNLIKIYEELINRDPQYVFDTIVNNAKIYGYLTLPPKNSGTVFDGLKSELNDLINVQAAPAYILLLYLFSLNNLPANFYKETIDLLVKYFFRRNITDFPNTRNLDQIFIDLIVILAEKKQTPTIDEISKYLTDSSRFSSDEVFREKLGGDLYIANVEATRFLLSKIEEAGSTKENRRDFWERDNSSKLVWTIEHIFPEGEVIPQGWVNMMAGGDRVKAEKIQLSQVHKLGNLTLTAYNPNLSNMDFDKKRDRVNNDGNYIGYRNNLLLNKDLKGKEQWTEQDIIERSKSLIDFAVSIFSINSK